MRIDYVNLGGLTTDANGVVTYNFQGNVYAQGLQMDTAPHAGNKLGQIGQQAAKWLNSLGQIVAEVYGWYDAGVTEGLELEVAPGGTGSNIVTALQLTHALGGGNIDRVRAIANGFTADVIRGDGTSDLVQNDSANRLHMAWGADNRLHFYVDLTEVASLPIGFAP